MRGEARGRWALPGGRVGDFGLLLVHEIGLEETGLRGGEAPLNEDALLAGLLELDMSGGVELRDHIVTGVWHEQLHGVERIGDLFEASGDELIEMLAAAGGNEKSVGGDEVGAVECGFIRGVDFVEDGEDGFIDGSEFLEHGESGLVVLGRVGVRDVDDMNQKIGQNDLFKRGFECLDETVRQAADEADGVRDQQLLVAAQLKLARGGIERGEQLVFGENGGAGERVEQGRFAGVGVADDRRGGDGHALTTLALRGALFTDIDQLAFEGDDAVIYETAILLELGFAFAAHAARAALPGEMAPCAGEAGERILHAGERDLKHRLAGLSAVGKDLEDDLLPVDHGELGQFLPVALLRGGQGFVEDDDVAALGFGEIDQFFGFAAAQERRGRGDAELDQFGPNDSELEILDEFGELLQQLGAFTCGHRFGLNAHQKGAFDFFRAFVFEKISHQCCLSLKRVVIAEPRPKFALTPIA